MPHALSLANILPTQPLLLAAPVLIILAGLALIIMKKSKAKNAILEAWTSASNELGIKLSDDEPDNEPVAYGKVNNHVVRIASVPGKGRKQRSSTRYSIKFEAPEAPNFALIKRDADYPIVDTGNPKFDAVVAIQTEQPTQLSRYLTAPRRAAILRLLTYWPTAEISNREAHLLSTDIESDHEKLVDSICHLVAAAETFDRPSESLAPATIEADAARTQQSHPPVVADSLGASPDDQPPADLAVASRGETSAEPHTEQAVNGDVDVLTEVRLDEVTVLHDLFNTGLDEPQIAARFQQIYQGRDVSWAGQVLRVGATGDGGRQRIAALIGSADGLDPSSGRVVALTAVSAEPVLGEGDIVSFSGTLVNLDAAQRLFHVA